MPQTDIHLTFLNISKKDRNPAPPTNNSMPTPPKTPKTWGNATVSAPSADGGIYSPAPLAHNGPHTIMHTNKDLCCCMLKKPCTIPICVVDATHLL